MKKNLIVGKNAENSAIGISIPEQKGEIDLELCEKNGIPPVMVGDTVQVNNSSGIKLAAIVTGIADSFEEDGAISAVIFGAGGGMGAKVKYGAQGWCLKDHKTKRLQEKRLIH